MLLSRRRILTGLLAAPIVVRAGLLMPVKPTLLGIAPWGADGMYGPFPLDSDWNNRMRELMAAIHDAYHRPIQEMMIKQLGALT